MNGRPTSRCVGVSHDLSHDPSFCRDSFLSGASPQGRLPSRIGGRSSSRSTRVGCPVRASARFTPHGGAGDRGRVARPTSSAAHRFVGSAWRARRSPSRPRSAKAPPAWREPRHRDVLRLATWMTFADATSATLGSVSAGLTGRARNVTPCRTARDPRFCSCLTTPTDRRRVSGVGFRLLRCGRLGRCRGGVRSPCRRSRLHRP